MIIELNDKAWTPEYTINRLNEIKEIEHIAISLMTKDRSTITLCSMMPDEILALLSKRLDMRLEWAIIQEQIEDDCPNDEKS